MVVEVENLTKVYKVPKRGLGLLKTIKSVVTAKNELVTALKGISFTIDEGELVGFIGPNGAGKTTTLKILSGLLWPTSGRATVLGFIPQERKTKFLSQISFVTGQKNQLWWDLPPIDSFELNRAIYQIDKQVYQEKLTQLIEILDAKKLINTPVRKLSLGQRMRAELIAALLHNPKVIFLDEPTIGLDVVAQEKIRNFIKTINQTQKTTIMLTSHNMADVAKLCHRVIVIDQGQIIFDGQLSSLTKRYSQHKIITATVTDKSKLPNLKDLTVAQRGSQITLSTPNNKTKQIVEELLSSGAIGEFTVESQSLDDIIRTIFARQNE